MDLLNALGKPVGPNCTALAPGSWTPDGLKSWADIAYQNCGGSLSTAVLLDLASFPIATITLIEVNASRVFVKQRLDSGGIYY